MLKIWGRDNSVNVQKVLWACEEMRLTYERIDAGGPFGIVDTPDYRTMNPNGLVPTVEVDGLVLWESNAIVRYLAAKHSAGSLWPTDLAVRVDGDRWMDWMTSMFWPCFRDLFWNLIRTPVEKRDPQALEISRQKTQEALAGLNTHLVGRHYIAGDAFTMGDIPMGCAIWRWMSLPIERPAYPALERWFAVLCERPHYKKIVMRPLS